MSELEIKGIGRLARMMSVFGVAQFFLLTFIAAVFYPGGFDYLGYFFSDLGAVVAKKWRTQLDIINTFFHRSGGSCHNPDSFLADYALTIREIKT